MCRPWETSELPENPYERSDKRSDKRSEVALPRSKLSQAGDVLLWETLKLQRSPSEADSKSVQACTSRSCVDRGKPSNCKVVSPSASMPKQVRLSTVETFILLNSLCKADAKKVQAGDISHCGKSWVY